MSFIEGDCKKIETVFPATFLATQPHQWVVIEDARDGMEAVLGHCHLTSGDYIVCEDTNANLPSAAEADYDKWGLPKLHAWKRFLAKHGDKYAIDTFFTDLFGYNSTSNWDGFVRRMK